MDLAPQLFVGLLVEASVFAVDGNDSSDHFEKFHLFSSEITLLQRLDTYDAD